MPWGRVDDTAYDNPKLMAVSMPAVAVYFLALSYCNRHLTDGLVVARSLRLIRCTPRLAKELLAEGLWEPDKSGYRVHNFLKDGRNKSRAQVEQERADAAARQRRAREASAKSRRDIDVTSVPPSRPVPSPTDSRSTRETERDGAASALTRIRDLVSPT